MAPDDIPTTLRSDAVGRWSKLHGVHDPAKQFMMLGLARAGCLSEMVAVLLSRSPPLRAKVWWLLPLFSLYQVITLLSEQWQAL
ncbi:hypothetical protein L209DRAFT_48407 [Thermothelomyces heterothallicus CBS 203.75]